MKLKELEQDLLTQENMFKNNPDDATLEAIIKLKYEYNTLLSSRVRAILHKTQQNYFDLGDKPHRLLTRQLRHSQASRASHKIRDRLGNLITDPVEINKCFAHFYEEL